MAYGLAHTVSLRGAVGHLIDVQADVSPGQVGLTIVGRVDSAVSEGRDRVRMAIINSGIEWPATKRMTVLFSPADLPKTGTHHDLALACSILAANQYLPDAELDDLLLIGELALDGGVRAVAGALPMVLAAAQRGITRVMLPETQVAEASLLPGIDVIGVRSLAQVVAMLRGEEVPWAPPVPQSSGGTLLSWRGEDRLDEVDMSDLIGLREAKYAAEVAAAGGHHLGFSGPKGCGKTSLAERIPSILPDLDPEVSVELTALQSLAGLLDPARGLTLRPPYSAPHHDCSKPSLVGGGTGRVRPGLLSLTHGGVILLDEFPLFRTDVIDALRQPLESGEVTVARGDESVTLPARSIVVMASNPCPCGNKGLANGDCRCRSTELRDYERRIRGPLLDRVDITVRLNPAMVADAALAPLETSAEIRQRVEAARQRQSERYRGFDWRLNAHVPGVMLRKRWPLPYEAQREIDQAIMGSHLSRRGGVRVHRLAWTVADLAEVDQPGLQEVQVALRLRRGDSLPEHALSRRAG
ncbi:hypothetical protein Back2_25100 [Nocardioides baekrokdamisoli]|uniref:AAA+ ATPase domain-containing protein n=1 Tax=Nocardioides baekrokdamisoli TaxID=1804624 RepID=A0A3G9J0R6_9ACTN|nr:YifB family Mg chelatase-like AAA ATPase [Nocardioides baekrokdamisoli]BBH18223.1 hypothetical protein Back2_25100 [Nocardioides baekrokdamisoli]